MFPFQLSLETSVFYWIILLYSPVLARLRLRYGSIFPASGCTSQDFAAHHPKLQAIAWAS